MKILNRINIQNCQSQRKDGHGFVTYFMIIITIVGIVDLYAVCYAQDSSRLHQMQPKDSRISIQTQGDCDLPLLGDPDCNTNSTPDECDIENCADLPSCDDCNLNDIPDGCDITAGTSQDLDLDGIPDECVFYDGEGLDDNWGTPENWDDDEVPNNLDLIDRESVTVGFSNVELDLRVEVDTLRLQGGTVLSVMGLTDEDFDVSKPGGLLIRSNTFQQSVMTVGNGRIIEVKPGIINIESGGVFSNVTSSSLAGMVAGVVEQPTPEVIVEADGIRVSSKCGEPIAGEMTLGSTSEAYIMGDVVLDASEDCVVCGFCSQNMVSSSGTVAGGETPPILRIKDFAVLRIEGNLILQGGVQFVHTSSSAIEIGGSFVNHSTCPECFDLSGKIIFVQPSFSAAIVATATQVIEAASRDLGIVADGFSANFAFDTLEIARGANVDIVDEFPNHGGVDPDAIYVDRLILREGVTINLQNSNFYYNTLINEGANIQLLGSGELIETGLTNIPTVSEWGIITLIILLLIAGTLTIRDTSLVC